MEWRHGRSFEALNRLNQLATEPRRELVSRRCHVCYTIFMKTTLARIHTKDGIELVGLLYEPDSPTDKILVHVHGMAGNFYENKFLDNIAETLTTNGIAFFAFNNRGCEFVKDLTKIEGTESKFVQIGDIYELFEESALDIEAAIHFAHDKGFVNVHLSGHSLGASKVAYYVTQLEALKLASVIFLSPPDMVGLFQKDKNYQRDMAFSVQMATEGKSRELIPRPGIWGEYQLSAQTYISLGSRDSNVAIFNFYNQDDPLETLGKITVPTLAVMGRKDDALVISIEDTMDRLKNALVASAKIETNILGDAGHGYHNYEQALAEVITTWIQKI